MTTKTPEELLRPRYIVIADYPGSDLPIGTILYYFNNTYWTDGKGYEFHEPERIFTDYPHLFRRLEWWEHRSPEEMPEYLKSDPIDKNWMENIVVEKIDEFYGDKNEYVSLVDRDESMQYCTSWYIPATLEEYTNYLTNKK